MDGTGRGDVTKTHVKWRTGALSQGIASPIVVGDFLFRLFHPHELVVMRLSDGKEVSSELLDGLTSSWASPIADPNGNLFFANAGTSVVVKAGPKVEILAVNKLGDPNHASAAVAGGRMYLVGRKKIYCIGKK